MAPSVVAGAADPAAAAAVTGPGPRRAAAPPWVWPVLLLGLVALVRAVPVLDARRPVWLEDEMGYLLNARFLSGVGPAPHFGEMASYQGGWSLLLVPLWWVLDEPDHVYRAGAALGAALGALALVPCARIALRAGAGRASAWAFGAVAVLLPGPVLVGGYALSEGVMALLVPLVVLAALRYAEAPTVPRAATVAALAVAAHVCHGRAIAFPLLVAAWGAWSLLVRGRRADGATALAVAGLGGWAGVAFNGWLVDRLYDPPVDRLASGLGSLAELDARAVLILTGQLWYLGVSSLGLSLLGLGVLARRAGGELRAMRPSAWTFALGVVSSVLVISSVSFVPAFPDPPRLDYFAYGRYADSVSAVLLVLGLTALSRCPVRRLRAVGVLTLLPVVLAAVVHLGWGGGPGGPAATGRPLAALNMAGVAAWLVRDAGAIPWVGATAVSVGAGLLLLLLARTSRAGALLGVAVLFTVTSVVGELATMRPLDRPWATLVSVDGELRALAPTALSYDTSAGQTYGRNSYQFWLPRTRFEFVDLTRQPPRTDLVVSARDWEEGEALGARRVVAEVRVDQALYVMPGRLQDDLAQRGWLEVLPGRSLPGDARVSSLSVERVEPAPAGPGAADGDGLARVVVTLGHRGAGAVWSPLGTVAEGSGGVVRVLGQATCDGRESQGLGDLPTALVPGERTQVAVLVPVGPGPCDLTLQALEEGVSTFGDVATARLG